MAGAGTPGWETYNRINSEIKSSIGSNDVDPIAQVFMVADLATTIVDGITGLPTNAIKNGLQSLISGAQAQSDMPICNPYFMRNGWDEAISPYTKKYLRNRSIKSAGSTVLSVAGTVASAHTLGINVGGAASDLNAVGSTGVHMIKLVAIGKAYKQTFTISRWCEVIMIAKKAKIAIRGTSAAGNLIPAASLGVSVATSLAKAGVTLTLNNLVYATAAEVHWRAFQEQQVSGGLSLGTGGKIGPASKLFWEIFTRRGATRLFGTYDIARLVAEPGGWQALGDKLMNI